MTTNWKEMIKEAADDDEIIACTLTEDELLKEFDAEWGVVEEKPFTAWSEKYVYFPVTANGGEWVGRAPRNPCDEATKHQGGG